nr:truncated ORF7b [Severe acute respiratory syndrome coronavirus 2]
MIELSLIDFYLCFFF